MNPDCYSCIAVVPAAGLGTRLQSVTEGNPKTLFKLNTPEGERSLLSMTVMRLLSSELFSGVVVACNEQYLDQVKDEFDPSLPISFIIGGKTRQESVFKALDSLIVREVTHVAIHDAARPFVSMNALKEVVNAGVRHGAAVLVERVTSTLKKVLESGEITETFPRNEFFLAQTPQVFDFNLILNAHLEAVKAEIDMTDDSQLVERMGIMPLAVINSSLNPKITEPSDLELARILSTR